MSSPVDLAETRARMLGELAELGLALARDLQQAALAAEDPQDKVRLADAFARVGRGVRQSLALHARLALEAVRDAAEAEVEAARLEPARRARRKAQVQAAVEAIIWREHERLDADPDILLEELEACLDDEAEAEGFLHEGPEILIARLCRTLELPVPGVKDGEVPADAVTHAAHTPASPQAPHDRPPPPPDPGRLPRDGEQRRSSA